MKIKTLQWNIGGGKILRSGADPRLMESYSVKNLDHIVEIIKLENPDIVSLQETHASKDFTQVANISEKCNLPYFFNEGYADSHLEPGQKLGLSIISRFPFSKHSFELFINPGYKVIKPSGEEWIMHDKGTGRCTLHITESIEIEMITIHSFPFDRFNKSPFDYELKNVRADIAYKIIPHEDRAIIQGDFNCDSESLHDFVPDVFAQGVEEIQQSEITTPQGTKFDHVLYKGLKVTSSKVIKNVLTDHYPIVIEFEV